MADHRTRRVKILQVNPEFVLQLMKGQPVECVSLPVTDDIPEGAEVLAVHDNWATRSIEFLITHESFPEVPDGDFPPRLNDTIEYRQMRRVPTPFITAEEYREFLNGVWSNRVCQAVYDEAKKVVESMVDPLEGYESPEFVELRQKLLCGLAEQQRKHSKTDLTV